MSLKVPQRTPRQVTNLSKRPDKGHAWLHEVKLDGCRFFSEGLQKAATVSPSVRTFFRKKLSVSNNREKVEKASVNKISQDG
jgi:ATP-dependent DNA ligase